MYVKAVHFKNVKGFADQKFEFGQDGKYAGWHVFVGGNASGKSTVLKGLALALAGPQAGNRLLPTTAGWITQGELHGTITIELERDQRFDKFGKSHKASGAMLKAAVEWDKPNRDAIEVFRQAGLKNNGLSSAESGLWDLNAEGWFCAGYGPLRRLTGSSSEVLNQLQHPWATRWLTLFREDAALSESEAWLKNLHSKVLEEQREQANRLFKLMTLGTKESDDSKRFRSKLSKEEDEKLTAAAIEMARSVINFFKLVPNDANQDLIKLMQQSKNQTYPYQLPSQETDTQNLADGCVKFLNDGLLPHDLKIVQVSVEEVLLKDANGKVLPMRDLSDGCRISYALVLDLVRQFADVYETENLFTQDIEGRWCIDKPGIVLIDEVESHLHPMWQQTLPEWLKAHFPQVQFIVTTHSPLILQAADPGGIYVLPLQDEVERKARRLSESEYTEIKLGRAEKALLGGAFGLQHSRSRWANEQIERWQWLDAKLDAGGKLTPKERTEYNKLKKQMDVIFETVWEEDIK